MIKLTRQIKGKKVELDLISLNGKTVVRDSSFGELKKQGYMKRDLSDIGVGIESDELKLVKNKRG